MIIDHYHSTLAFTGIGSTAFSPAMRYNSNLVLIIYSTKYYIIIKAEVRVRASGPLTIGFSASVAPDPLSLFQTLRVGTQVLTSLKIVTDDRRPYGR